MAKEEQKYKVLEAFEYKRDDGQVFSFEKDALVPAETIVSKKELKEFLSTSKLELVSEKPKEKTVELKKEDYDRLMATLERNAKDIDLLYAAADKGRLAKAMGDGGEILVREVRVWTWDGTGKIVMGTNLISNKCEIVQGRWIEDQQISVVLEDGETFQVPYLEFSRKILHKIPAEIISTKKTTDSKNKEVVIFEVQLPDGKKLEINSAFVN